MSRWTNERIAEITGWDPVNKIWIKEMYMTEADKLRFSIHGDLEGYPVHLNIYDSDLSTLDEDGRLIGIGNVEIGVLQFVLGQMQQHGINPAFRKRTETSGSTDSSKPTWECSVHGSRAIYDNKFQPGKKQCSYWEKAVDFNAPSW